MPTASLSIAGNPAQSDTFAWWLSQPPGKRKAKDIAEFAQVSIHTARLWLVDFNKALAKAANQSVGIALRTYRDEYEAQQARTIEALPSLSRAYQSKLDEINKNAQEGKSVDTEELNKLTSGLKTLYQLAEQASGADLAKKRAAAQADQGSAGGFALPMLEEAYDLLGIEAETTVSNDSGNEISPDSDESPET